MLTRISTPDTVSQTVKPAIVRGALRWNRTIDTRIFSPLLYLLSYQGVFGERGENRTLDPSIKSALLYQLSYPLIVATRKGVEPSTFGVTGQRSDQLSYRAMAPQQISLTSIIHRASHVLPLLPNITYPLYLGIVMIIFTRAHYYFGQMVLGEGLEPPQASL